MGLLSCFTDSIDAMDFSAALAPGQRAVGRMLTELQATGVSGLRY